MTYDLFCPPHPSLAATQSDLIAHHSSPLTPNRRIAASIVLHNTPVEQLQRCLNSLAACPLVARIHLIDNSPSPLDLSEILSLPEATTRTPLSPAPVACDGSTDLSEILSPSEGLLPSSRAVGRQKPLAFASTPHSSLLTPHLSYSHVENRGYGAGHNIAIRRTLDDPDLPIAHLVLNADTYFDGDILTPMVEYMAANPETGIMMPKVYYPDGDLQLTSRRLPTPFDLMAKRFLPAALTRRHMRRYLLADIDHDRIIDAPYLLGSFLLIRTDALRAEGLFDERFFMYPEDIDITRRIHRRWRTIHYPRVSIIHHHAAASRRDPRMLRIHITNMIRYFNKWGWFIDPERRRFNRRLDRTAPRLSPSATPPPARG